MTDRFYISEFFDPVSKVALKDALKKATLPEGVSVVKPSEIGKAKKPFIVITFSASTIEARDSYQAGAIKYELMDMNSERLSKKISS